MRIRVGILVVGLAGLGALAARPAGAQQCGSECNCEGGILHRGHGYSVATCTGVVNPHFSSQISDDAYCDDGASGALTCNGCYACCNGWYAATDECICDNQGPGQGACRMANDYSRTQCRGGCVGTWEGNGCTNPGEEIGPVSKTLASCMLLVAVGLGAAGAGPAASLDPTGPALLLDYSEWKDESGTLTARGLDASLASGTRFLSRKILVTPAGNHVVMTSEYNFERGEGWDLFLDEERQWWAKLTSSTNVRGVVDPRQVAREFREDGAWATLSLSTSDGFWWQGDEDSDWDEEVKRALERSEGTPAIPETTREAVAFVLSLARQRAWEAPGNSRALLEALLGGVQSPQPYGKTVWSVTSHPPVTHVEEIEEAPVIRMLLQEFQTVSRDDPFEDRP